MLSIKSVKASNKHRIIVALLTFGLALMLLLVSLPSTTNAAVTEGNGGANDTSTPTTSPEEAAAAAASSSDEQRSRSKAQCNSSGVDFAWFLCGVFNHIGEGADWVFDSLIQPFLVAPIIGTGTDDPTYQIWSSFRTYGNVFLLIALLVVVFGQSIGGGLIDAYSAKKILPRLLAAAILINLSIYLVNFAVDITNLIGGGLGQLLGAPLAQCVGQNEGNCWTFEIEAGQQASIFGVGLIGLFVSGGSVAGVIGALTFGGGAAGAGAMAAFLIALPVLFAILAVFVTLVLRQGIILMLLLVSPVAFALYCLPNTERYFKKWWETLVKTLMVYPIVIVVFAAANLLSVMLLVESGVTPQNLSQENWATENTGAALQVMIAFFLQFLPLFLIPFSFRLAGGVIGRLGDAVLGASAKVGNATKTRKERAKHNWQGYSSQARERLYDRSQSSNRAARFLGKNTVGMVAGENIKAVRARYNAETFKELQAQNDTGDDTLARALSVNKQSALATGAAGNGTHWRNGSNGQRQFRTLGGAWVDESAVDHAQSIWGGNQSALQWSLGHEMEKAATQEEQDYLRTNYDRVANGFGATSDTQKGGIWTGAAFAKQNINRQWKHYKWDAKDNELKMGANNALGMFREIDEKQGSYAMLQQNADTWTTMSQAMQEAKQIKDGTLTHVDTRGLTQNQIVEKQQQERAQADEILLRGARIAAATRSSSMVGDPSSEEGQVPPTMRAAQSRAVGAGAAGRVQEEMHRFVNMSDASAGTYSLPTGQASIATRLPEGPERSIERRQEDNSGPTPTGTGGAGPRAD